MREIKTRPLKVRVFRLKIGEQNYFSATESMRYWEGSPYSRLVAETTVHVAIDLAMTPPEPKDEHEAGLKRAARFEAKIVAERKAELIRERNKIVDKPFFLKLFRSQTDRIDIIDKEIDALAQLQSNIRPKFKLGQQVDTGEWGRATVSSVPPNGCVGFICRDGTEKFDVEENINPITCDLDTAHD